MRKLLKTLALVAVFSLVAYAAGSALAQTTSGDIFDTANTKLSETFQRVKTVVYIMGGFGLIGLAVAALLGKVQWKWLFALVTGLAIVAISGAIIDYATDAGTASTYTQDTLGGSSSSW